MRRGERCRVSRLSAVECLANKAHLARDREVSNPHFAHIIIHVLAESIEQALPQLSAAAGMVLEAAQHQYGMQHDHLQPGSDRVGHPVALVKGGISRLCHDGAIERVDVGLAGGGGKPAKHHWLSSQLAAVTLVPPLIVTAGRYSKCKSDMGIAVQTSAWDRPSRLAAGRAAAAVLAFALLLAGCFQETFHKGYIVPEGALEQIPVGSSQEQVLLVLGTPSTVATVSGEAYYYISQATERLVGFMPQTVTDQRVIAVYFDKKRRVERLADYRMKDGRVFDFVSRTTPTGGKEVGILTGMLTLNPFGGTQH